MKTIAVLTSGGDAPGMNAAIRAVVRTALGKGLRVKGVRDGYSGLLQGRWEDMTAWSVGNIVQRGGTILGTTRCDEFLRPEARQRAIHNLRTHRVDGLITIGGDGTFRGAHALRQEGGPPVIGIPGTIDNDLSGTDKTLGFDTAVNTALEAIDRLRDTAEALARIFIVEVMGRHRGFLALEVGLAGGADEVLLPEVPADMTAVCRRLRDGVERGKRSNIVVVAEGFGPGGASFVQQEVGRGVPAESRVCVLGHVQRGGSPKAADRVLGAQMGDGAVDALLQGSYDCHMAGVVNGSVCLSPLDVTWKEKKPPSQALLHLLQEISG